MSRALRNIREANSALQNRDPRSLRRPLRWVPALRSTAKRRCTASGTRLTTYAAGTGNAVTDLIFSIAKREVTFFSGTALISFL